jgi:hypothetical protein
LKLLAKFSDEAFQIRPVSSGFGAGGKG